MSRSEAIPLGGEFGLRIDDLAIDPCNSGALPGFGAAHERWLDTGRSALAVAAIDIAARGGRRKVWVPAYCCESVVLPFRERAYEVEFYGVGSRLRRIDARPAENDTLLFIHYFGHRNVAALEAIAGWRAQGVRIVEDCVQAGLTTAVGTHGDYAVSSLRKLLPPPDGALLASRAPLGADAAPSSEAFVTAKVAGKLLRSARADDETFLRLFEHAESLLEGAPPRRMSWISEQLLRAADLATVAARRRSNWTSLRERLRSSSRLRVLTPVIDVLDTGEVPLGLPVWVPGGQRNVLRRHLEQHRIYCAVHWGLEHLPKGEFDDECALSRALLTLPIDQRCDDRDLDRLVEALQAFPGDLR